MYDEFFSSEGNRPFLERQIDAVTGAIFIIGERRKITFQDAIRGLADAEKKANFECGFDLLDIDAMYKENLKRYLVEEGFITEDEKSCVALTPKGEERTTRGVPLEIETYLS